jgi:fatty-acyl-CoA synthase
MPSQCPPASFVPTNFRLRPHEMHYIADHSGATLLLVSRARRESRRGDRRTQGDSQRLVLGTQSDIELTGADATGYEWPAVDEFGPAPINYTSGTTARPKGVVLTH